MMPKKLVRATVPMCPECGELVEYKTLGRAGNYHVCIDATCLHHCTYPDYGYYVDDTVEEVVAEMRGTIESFGRNQYSDTYWSLSVAVVRGWIRKLEDLND
jgi:hypothetical protein